MKYKQCLVGLALMLFTLFAPFDTFVLGAEPAYDVDHSLGASQ